MAAVEIPTATVDAIMKGGSHPLRRQLLATMLERYRGPDGDERDGVPSSPNQLSKLLDEPLTNVSYHVRMLYDFGLIELTDTEPRRGALEHYYRPTRLGGVTHDTILHAQDILEAPF